MDSVFFVRNQVDKVWSTMCLWASSAKIKWREMPGLGFLHRTAGRFWINRFCPFADILWFSRTQTVEQSCTKTLMQPPFGFDSQAGFWYRNCPRSERFCCFHGQKRSNRVAIVLEFQFQQGNDKSVIVAEIEEKHQLERILYVEQSSVTQAGL